MWLCRGGQLRGRRDLFKSAKRNQAREAVCVYVCVCLGPVVDQAMSESQRESCSVLS